MTILRNFSALAISSLAILACNTPKNTVANGAAPKTGPSSNTVESIPASASRPDVELFTRPGYVTELRDERLWVFMEDSAEYEQFLRVGEPAKTVTRIRTGPGGISLRSSDRETLIGYENSTLWHHARVIDGRLWIFDNEKEDFRELTKHGAPSERVTFVGRGPERMTLCAIERETLHDWMYRMPGFHTEVVDGRLWVLVKGTEELDQFLEVGELAKSVTLIKAGPGGISLRGPSRETLHAYLAAKGM